MLNLPPFAPFPKASWHQHLSSQDWDGLIEAWIALSQAYLGLEDGQCIKAIENDESVVTFVSTFVEEAAAGSTTSVSSPARLLKAVFRLTSRFLTIRKPPQQLFEFRFLAGLAKVFPKKYTAPLLTQLFTTHTAAIEFTLISLKKLLIPQLDLGPKGDLNLVESRLNLLNHLLHISPDTCVIFLAGSDFSDGLVTCFRVMNPPLRKAIVTTLYLCLIGLIEAEPPKWSMVGDQLFGLQTAAEAHKKGPLNANDSLVADLATNTPILKVLVRKAEGSGAATANLRNRITALEAFKTGVMVRPKRLVKRKIDKGKGKETSEDAHAAMHIHKMSQITQVQDLFPDLGAGFVSKCLDEYHDDVEQVVANLLGESLPPHLATVDRAEPLSSQPPLHVDLAPQSTPPQLPTRRNVFDGDDFDRLAMDVSKVSFGKNPEKTADDVLKDKSTAPNKAAILSALAAFDSDDDERDDTYDAADVGGTVDAGDQEADGVTDRNEEVLFRAYQSDPRVFGREAETKRSSARGKLREETGMSDEAIEGWAVILARNPQQMKRLEAKFAFSGQQAQLGRTSWRASPAGSGAEESDPDGGNSARGGRGRGRGGRGRGGRGRGGMSRGLLAIRRRRRRGGIRSRIKAPGQIITGGMLGLRRWLAEGLLGENACVAII
ncbi:Activating signal cointegrator 1 complex subunit 2 [Cladobotryum mycophilum]|uniref:Activating signal cointegrator 1 complex subunit 2 n=1 Tax=Cladobotryum mycophilum TaxID=491253 RepID=A0ABR0SV04_9HYPO